MAGKVQALCDGVTWLGKTRLPSMLAAQAVSGIFHSLGAHICRVHRGDEALGAKGRGLEEL